MAMVMTTTAANLLPRQIWAVPTHTTGSLPHTCEPFRIASGGQLNIGQGTIITLTQDAAFQPACGEVQVPPPIDPLQPGVDLSVLDARDAWYSSTIPQMFAISAVTVVSYMLVIILFITPRTFFVGGAGGGGGFLGQRGVIGGAYGSNSVIGIGSRPWLQKIAALSVAISLTIVTADSLKWAHRQYDAGYEDATELTLKVIKGLEVRIVRVISETFLWLAQAQTLIRLFPRHKEKLLIKWIAFALILLELIFSTLNNFLVENTIYHSKRLVAAVPAMNYLFALTLNLCYGGFIIVYALQKRRFAFYHPDMRNMPLVALLSLTAVLIPVVFFVLDLSKPNVSGWGNYVRWVGSAAASVVVWEWVERIEALERDEKKGGILGREIYDGDEMLDVTPDSNTNWPMTQRDGSKWSRRNSGSGFGLSTGWSRMNTKGKRPGRSRPLQRGNPGSGEISDEPQFREDRGTRLTEQNATNSSTSHPDIHTPSGSTGVRTPASARSPAHVVRSQATDGANPGLVGNKKPMHHLHLASEQAMKLGSQEDGGPENSVQKTILASRRVILEGLQRMPNPFRRARETPPPEVARALAAHLQEPGVNPNQSPGRPGMLERLHLKKTPKPTGPPRPVIVVPAPPRRRSSWNDSFSPGGEDNVDHEHTGERSLSDSGGHDSSRDVDLPPDAVLNAMSNLGSVSPLPGDVQRNVH